MKLSSTYAENVVPATRSITVRRVALLFCILLGLFAAQAFAQEATIVGTVTDPTGAAVPNVAIAITNTDTGLVRNMTTNDVGQYVAPNLPIGHYTVRAEGSGFKVSEQKGIVLNVGDRDRIDFQMQVGTRQESVTVEAGAVAVQTETGEVSSLITGTQVTQLATNGRSLLTLYNLTPGASSIQPDFQVPTPVGGNNSVSFNGNRVGHNLMLIDGSENLDRGGTGVTVMPSMDSVAEFRTLTSNYSAEYGLSSAGTLTTVLKSGSKTFHASAWEFARNDAFDARDFTHPAGTTTPRMLRFHTYGFNASGQAPFWKSKPTFFFYNMEWRSLIQGGSLNTTVPFTDTYGGNFINHLPADLSASDGVVPNSGFHVPCSDQLSAAQQTRFNNAGITTFSTSAGGSCAVDKTKTIANNPHFVAFPSSAIPTALLDANAQSLLGAGIFPAPTSGGQFLGGANAPTKVREEIARVDHQFSDKFSVFGHWVSEQVTQGFGTTIWSGDNVPTIGSTFGNPSYSAVVHATYIINPTLLNETAFNYNGNRINITPVGVFAAPSGFTFNRIFTGPNDLNRAPNINVTNGPNYTVNWVPWNNKADDYQLRDDISWTKGAHQLKFGASWALYKKIQDLFASTQGSFTFNGKYTGSSFGDYLLGYAQGYSEAAVKDAGHWNNVSWALYLQDNWRVNNRLTLNLGLRWDGIPHTYEANQRFSNFYPDLYNPANKALFTDPLCNTTPIGTGCNPSTISPTSPGLGSSPNPILAGYQFYLNGIGIDGKNGIPKGLVDNYWKAFGPRLGFAYDLTGQGKTVIRGGFGLMYERIQGNDVYNGGTNVPFSANAGFNDVLLSNPHTGVTSGSTITTPPLPITVGSITGLNRKAYDPPRSYQYSIGMQQSLGTGSVLSVSYVGIQNRDQSQFRQIDLPAQSQLAALQGNSSTYNASVPYLGFRDIRLAENVAEGHYNGLQVDLRSRMHGLQLQFGYTYSKAYDSASSDGNGFDLNNLSNPYAGWKYDSGPSFLDRRSVAFVNFVYDLPLFKNGSRALKSTLGGWQVSGIIAMQTGAPFNITVGGNNISSVIPNTGNRPDLNGKISYPKEYRQIGTTGKYGFQWFDPSVFSTPGAGLWGTMPHNAVYGPGRDNWNLSLFKNFTFTERLKFELRAETFNTFNHLQLGGSGIGGGISGSQGSTNFGMITGAYDPRTIQLGGKIIF